MNFFVYAGTSTLTALNLAQRAFFVIDAGRSGEMVEIMGQYGVEPKYYQQALQELVTGCALGGFEIKREKVASMAERLQHQVNGAPLRRKRVEIVAKSLYREMENQGFNRNEMLAVATEILGLVTDSIKNGK